ncbi:MAG: asparagine synthetase B, partial [Deltaproteobacteria bacterium]|nr:asparagine synthetase B [Deltaproteobacteria bacterium]
MCGICGEFSYAAGDVNPETVLRMTSTMAHRGPDADGTYLSPDRRVGFGHRRLSIIDLSEAGRQPMCNEDRTVWITFNGEIYNHEEVRRELVARGHTYQSRTDTETIVHAYEQWGVEAIDRLHGMFAFAIWDERRGKMLLVRDRIGIKPLYFCQSGGRLLFGSEIKAILAHGAVTPDLDEDAAFHYLSFMVTPAPMTMFAGIRKLPA